MPKTRRELPCEECGIGVRIASRKRFLRLVKSDESVLCEQCRRFVLPGTARMSQDTNETVFPSMALRHKRGRRAKRVGVLESCPVSMCGKPGYDVAVSAD